MKTYEQAKRSLEAKRAKQTQLDLQFVTGFDKRHETSSFVAKALIAASLVVAFFNVQSFANVTKTLHDHSATITKYING